MRVSGQVMKLLFVAGALLAGVLGLLPLPAGAVGPEPAPLAPPVQLTVGYQKVGHLAPVILVADKLKKLGVDLKLVEFVRYADARTALLAGSLDRRFRGPRRSRHLAGAGIGRCCRADGCRLVTEIRDWPKGRAVRFLG